MTLVLQKKFTEFVFTIFLVALFICLSLLNFAYLTDGDQPIAPAKAIVRSV